MLPSPATRADDGLVRGIGVWTLAAGTVNMTIGAGIFVLPAVVAGGLGAAGLLAYGVCAIAIGLIALCHVECGSRVTSSGGPAAYVGAAFGPFAQFVIGTLLWAAWGVASDAAVATAFAGMVGQVVPAAREAAGRTTVLALLLGGLAWFNIRGVRMGARIAAGLTVAKLVPLVFFVLVGVHGIQAGNLSGLTHAGASQVGTTSLVLFFAFCGTETALTPGAEIDRPARTIPLAVLIGLLVVVGIYGTVQLVAQGVLGAALVGAVDAPLADAARRVAGPFGASVMVAGGALSMFSLIAGDLLATPRAIFRLAADGQLPALMARVHPRYRTPWTAILTYAGVAFVLATSSRFDALASAASAAILLVYASVAAAALALRRRGIVSELPPFVTPGGPVVPVLALAIALWLLAYTPTAQAIGLAVLTLGIALIYGVMVLLRPPAALALDRPDGTGPVG